MPEFKCTITENIAANGMRVDRYIAENLRLLSRSQIKARELKAHVNGKEIKISHIVKKGDTLALFWNEAEPEYIIPENIPLNIMHEDDRVVVINKEQGMVVHPGAGNRCGTLANALYYRILERGSSSVMAETGVLSFSDAGIKKQNTRPGIVHRLDKDTSGVMIAAYDDSALAFLADQFKSRTVKKTYIAIINGSPQEKKGRIATFIARDVQNRKRFAIAGRGKRAVTYYKIIKTWHSHSLVLLRPKTGRTHQLRVHMRYLGHPIAGDPLYGTTDKIFPQARLMLHAKSLAIIVPGADRQKLFKAPLPERFRQMIKTLNKGY